MDPNQEFELAAAQMDALVAGYDDDMNPPDFNLPAQSNIPSPLSPEFRNLVVNGRIVLTTPYAPDLSDPNRPMRQLSAASRLIEYGHYFTDEEWQTTLSEVNPTSRLELLADELAYDAAQGVPLPRFYLDDSYTNPNGNEDVAELSDYSGYTTEEEENTTTNPEDPQDIYQAYINANFPAAETVLL